MASIGILSDYFLVRSGSMYEGDPLISEFSTKPVVEALLLSAINPNHSAMVLHAAVCLLGL